ncbi:MAG TPA: sugar O-acetyltransferase [Bacteroidetes bacterium]|nr:sugar O-acetyltransferase [Bacteroidota bacterium]HEX05374.1 sugar O-acetyltransferase [Bacteroidota bacterium]
MDDKGVLTKEIFSSIGSNLEIWGNFFCEFGENITIGDNVFLNSNCVILDLFKVSIGDNTSIGSNVGIFTSNHALDPKERMDHIEYGAPISIGKSVWVGGNAVLLPGVDVGTGAVIAAGSVVTENIPPGHKYIVKNKETVITNI